MNTQPHRTICCGMVASRSGCTALALGSVRSVKQYAVPGFVGRAFMYLHY